MSRLFLCKPILNTMIIHYDIPLVDPSGKRWNNTPIPVETFIYPSTLPLVTKHCTALCTCWDMYQSVYITFGNKILYCSEYLLRHVSICLHYLWQQNIVLLCAHVETCINLSTLTLATKHCTVMCTCWDMYQSVYITFGNKALYCTVYLLRHVSICLHYPWQQSIVLPCVSVETCINLSTLPLATKHCTALCTCWDMYQSVYITCGNKALYCFVHLFRHVSICLHYLWQQSIVLLCAPV